MKDTKEFLKNAVDTVKSVAAYRGGFVTEKEMAEKAGISSEQLYVYLEGKVKVPEGLVSKLLSAYDIQLKMVRVIQEVDIDLPPDDELDEGV
jgi:hypothetical protein